MKPVIKHMIACILIPGLVSCAGMNTRDTDRPGQEEWSEKVSASKAYSPSARKRNYQFNRNPRKYQVDGLRRLPRKKISLRMINADVASVIRSLARLVDVNVLVSEKVKGTINVSVSDVPWNEVFDNILKTQGLTYVYNRNMIRILTDEDLVAELNRQKLKQSLEKMEPLETRIVKVDFTDAASLKACLLAFLNEPVVSGGNGGQAMVNEEASSIAVDTHTNSLVIRATETELAKILPVIEGLDRPTRQVLIEANIVETNRSTALELGAQWSNAGGEFTAGMDLSVTGGAFAGYTSTHGNSTLSMQLSALQTEGKLKILSSPSITTIDNKKAIIESGKEIPYQSIEDGEVSVEYKKAVIHLEVTPHVIDENMVKLEIATSKDEVDYSVEVNGNPGIITKKAETEVVLFNGNSTVIGGLNKDRDEVNRKGVPWLMNIPLIGHLFKWIDDTRELEELLIFITPRILSEKPVIAPVGKPDENPGQKMIDAGDKG